jgi:hypothetical protein
VVFVADSSGESALGDSGRESEAFGSLLPEASVCEVAGAFVDGSSVARSSDCGVTMSLSPIVMRGQD